jgi:hypothetical protein
MYEHVSATCESASITRPDAAPRPSLRGSVAIDLPNKDGTSAACMGGQRRTIGFSASELSARVANQRGGENSPGGFSSLQRNSMLWHVLILNVAPERVS